VTGPARHTRTGTDTKRLLHESLDRQRDAVVWKVTGLADAQLRQPRTPSSTSLAGLVKHLASVEYGWFCRTFGRPADEIPFDPADPEADMRAGPDETIADLLAYYTRARAAADETVDELDLAAVGTSSHGDPVSLHWVLVHMVEETARHAGHLDVLRELTDGQTGDRPSS